jgi:4-phytase/acid phosphatase
MPARGCPHAGNDPHRGRQRPAHDCHGARLDPQPGAGCALSIDHKPQDEPDSRFGAIEAGLSPYDPALADAAVRAAAAPDGLGAIAAAHRPLLARLDAILCGAHRTDAAWAGQPTALVPAKANGRPSCPARSIALRRRRRSCCSNMPKASRLPRLAGAGASAADTAVFSAFHALEFRAAGPPPLCVASANFAGLAPIVREGLTAKPASR